MKKFDREFIVAEHDTRHNRIIHFGNGRLIKSFSVELPLDIDLLRNGNLLLSSNRAIVEIDKNWKEVWKLESARLAFFSCQEMRNGNILFGDASKAMILEVDRNKKIIRSFDFPYVKEPSDYLYAFRLIREVAENRILIACYNLKKLAVFDWDGNVHWECDLPGSPYMPVQLGNSNILVSLGEYGKIVEINTDKEIVWEYDMVRDNQLSLGWIAGISILENGNIVYSDSKYDRLIEITKDKGLVSIFKDRNVLLHPSTHIICRMP
ncbi:MULTISPECIES: hypothetical protein [unclassified Arenibacter]|uniref:hypothetical protein n=1 Tax=unclassified Arenibacter TaxID=2615047 RepID=UPI000E341DB2|nr:MULTISPECIES: hypothetical protein [unclassified Arenibacter]MCM4164612.1 hypothetical protein [Arenibacter sp. A80]RFT55693.1 hypothetical protein D0S24_13490 [Arenibacter sp. P308M17]